MPAPAFVTRATRRMVEGKLSVPFAYNGLTLRGLWDEADVIVEDDAGGDQPRALKSMVVMSDDGPFVEFTTITTDGTSYQLRKALKMEDGVTLRLILAEVPS